jgi:hypothetical protein
MEAKMNRKHVSRGCLLTLAALAFTAYTPAQNRAGRETAASDAAKLITVLNPAIASKMAPRVPLAPRLDTLDGKTLYMADINWGGPEAAYSVFEEIQAWLAANKPTVKTVIRRIKGSYSSDDPELWKEIAKNGNAAIVGISG